MEVMAVLLLEGTRLRNDNFSNPGSCDKHWLKKKKKNNLLYNVLDTETLAVFNKYEI